MNVLGVLFDSTLCWSQQVSQTITESKSFFLLTLLLDLIMIPEFKKSFLNLPKNAFLPGKIEKLNGAQMDTVSPFGIFARISILGINPGFYHQ